MKSESVIERGIYLRALRRLWAVPLCMLLGAVLLLGGYQAAVRIRNTHTYEQVSKLYINFTGGPDSHLADWYNGATWTDLLSAHPVLTEGIGSRLGMDEAQTKQLVREHVTAEILSDIRLMTVTVRAEDAGLVGRLAEAVNGAVTDFGSRTEGFDSIEFLSSDPVREIRIDDRSRNAVLLGAFLGLIFGAAGLWMFEAVRLAVYTPEEAEYLYDVPCAGAACRSADGKEEKWNKELAGILAGKAAEGALVVSAKGAEDAAAAAARIKAAAGDGISLEPADVEEAAEKNMPCIIAALHSGRDEGAAVRRMISKLRMTAADPEIMTVITDGDAKLLDRYYRI
ncbi:MAG: hypothetical protein J6P87_05030 [Lachnospiraceae bacterium]|nr:hypothetical protein [Lachnospiraceae bacterium]